MILPWSQIENNINYYSKVNKRNIYCKNKDYIQHFDNSNYLYILDKNYKKRNICLLILSSDNSIEFYNKLHSICNNEKNNILLVTDFKPDYLPSNISCIVNIKSAQILLEEKKQLNSLINKIIFDSKDIKNKFKLFTFSIIKKLSQNKILDIVDISKKITDSCPNLFIFPERMLPTKRAFLVRGFDLILNLKYHQINSDVLIFGPNNSDLEKIKTSIAGLSNNVFVTPLRRRKVNLFTRYFRNIVVYINNLFSKSTNMKFGSRIVNFSSKHNLSKLENIINKNNYKNIIVTCAWMAPCIKNINDKYGLKNNIIIDTHDVFFYADKFIKGFKYYSSSKQKRLEINSLQLAKKIITLSSRDASILKKYIPDKKIITCMGSFEHISHSGYKFINKLRIGYIGTSNTQNELVINQLLNYWLPEILKIDQSIEFYFAGPCCNLNTLKVSSLDKSKNISLLGFIDNVQYFYDSIDVLFAPIVIPGGINFKSVEAICSGCEVLLSELGRENLPNLDGIYTIKNNSELNRIIKTINLKIKDKSRRHQVSKSAKEYFSYRNAYKELIINL